MGSRLVRLGTDEGVEPKDRLAIEAALQGALPKGVVPVELSRAPSIPNDRERIDLGNRILARLLLEASGVAAREGSDDNA